MSTVQENNPFEQMVHDMDIDTENIVRDNDLDLKTAAKTAMADLHRHRARRRDMVAKRAALKEAIKRTDKRIAIALETLKVIGTPT
jgi:hypothetical protein